jgi:tRNA (guanine6-N2)-methyltransferase
MSVRLTARCVRGLEWVLAAEVAERDDTGEVRLSERQVFFESSAPNPDLLGLSTADDLLLDLGALRGIDHTRAALGELADELGGIDFDAALVQLEDMRPLPAKLSFDVVASLLGRRNYNRFAVEDAAGAAIEDTLGARYVSRNPDAGGDAAGDTAETDVTVRLSLRDDTVEVALRVPHKPLHRRPWKLDTGPGTLHPPLAAALARIGGTAVPVNSDAANRDSAATGPIIAAIDPFCGDGTIAVETALAFPGATVLAADLDAGRLGNARANAERAETSARIHFVRADAGVAAWDEGRFDLVVTNPPWNRVVGAAGSLADSLYLDPFWQRLSAALGPGGRICTVAEVELGVPGLLRGVGYSVALAQTIRLAGRISHVVLATPPGFAEVALPPALSRWRDHGALIPWESPA